MVVDSIQHREKHGDWHVFEVCGHAQPRPAFSSSSLRGGLKWTLNDLERWTGHQAGKVLNLGGDRFWQREWFDHWSRSDEEDEKIVNYIRDNPVKGGTCLTLSRLAVWWVADVGPFCPEDNHVSSRVKTACVQWRQRENSSFPGRKDLAHSRSCLPSRTIPVSAV